MEHCLNGREIAVWGNSTRLVLRELKKYKYHIAECVDPHKYYVVTVNEDDLKDFKLDRQSHGFAYVNDYFSFSDYGRCLLFEWDCYNVKIGRQTYFGEKIVWSCGFGYIKSIGQFTSINNSAAVYGNHQMDISFLGDQIQDLFTDENKKVFKEKILSNPQNPYGKNKGGITIGNDVWIGANVFINASKVTRIGDGAIIGAGAVVLKDVPPYAIVAGVPAKVIRYRFSPEMIETLLQVKWWNWSVEDVNKNADALMSPDLFIKKFGNK